MTSPIVSVTCIKHIYPDEATVVLCGLDFVVHEGERVAVLGPSGSGKTTLFRHILGLLKPAEGTVRVFGLDPDKDFRRVRERIGFVFQNVDEQFTQPTVFDEIAFAPRNFGRREPEVRDMVEGVLRRHRIAHMRDRLPQYLSGGQKRLVALASALVLEPQLLILDEPFEGLDLASRREFIRFLNELWEEKKFAMVFSLHDVNIVPELSDIVYLVKPGGELSARGTPAEVFSDAKKLEEFRLEQPLLQSIFAELRRVYPELPPAPKTLEEALEAISRIKKQ